MKRLLVLLLLLSTVTLEARDKKFNYQGEVVLGYSFGLEEDFHYAKIDVINGVRFSRYFFAGAGIGIAQNLVTSSSAYRFISMPEDISRSRGIWIWLQALTWVQRSTISTRLPEVSFCSLCSAYAPQCARILNSIFSLSTSLIHTGRTILRLIRD